jgi:hypothetical protein
LELSFQAEALLDRARHVLEHRGVPLRERFLARSAEPGQETGSLTYEDPHLVVSGQAYSPIERVVVFGKDASREVSRDESSIALLEVDRVRIVG